MAFLYLQPRQLIRPLLTKRVSQTETLWNTEMAREPNVTRYDICLEDWVCCKVLKQIFFVVPFEYFETLLLEAFCYFIIR